MSDKKERVTVTLDPEAVRFINKIRYDNSFSSTINKLVEAEREKNFKRAFLSCFSEDDFVDISKIKRLKAALQAGEF